MSMMNATCLIQIKGQAGADSYGQPSPGLTTLVTGVPCRLGKQVGGKEFEAGQRFALADYTIFLPMITVGAGSPPAWVAGGTPFTLLEVHWLVVTCPDGKVVRVNIKRIHDPSGIGHHLEATGEVIIT
jgi:hypothetical protein